MAPESKKEHAMSTSYSSHAVGRHRKRFSFSRWIGRTRRMPRLDLAGLPDEILRDLGFREGHISPPRDLFRD
jgi:hypothetical protein